MKKTWEWLKKWGGLLFGGIAAVLLFILTAGWIWRLKKDEIAKLKDELAVSVATTNITALRAEREQLGERIGEKTERDKEIERELMKNQRQIVEAHEGMEDLSDEDMLTELTRLGY